jgi:hypothetical protein
MILADRHGIALRLFAAIMVAHWLEHIVQAYQVYALGYEPHHALGLLGQFYPWLVHSEWMHFGYAILTFVGLVLLRQAFCGPALAWWNIALVVQVWHLFEHALLFIQAQGGFALWGAKEPISVLQLFWPRVELHLFYNSVVTIPIVIALILTKRRQLVMSGAGTLASKV